MPTFDTGIGTLALVAILAYLAGSVPFGLVVSKVMGLPDPRSIGSHNIGATNVLRSGSKVAALLTLLLDGAKGGVAAAVAYAVAGADAAQVAGLAAFLGHVYPVFLRFKGGKGVATLLGVLFGLAPVVGLIACGIWLAAFLVFRYSSLSALIAAAVTPVAAVLAGYGEMFVVLVLMSALLFWRHRANIVRLREGTEPRVGQEARG